MWGQSGAFWGLRPQKNTPHRDKVHNMTHPKFNIWLVSCHNQPQPPPGDEYMPMNLKLPISTEKGVGGMGETGYVNITPPEH